MNPKFGDLNLLCTPHSRLNETPYVSYLCLVPNQISQFWCPQGKCHSIYSPSHMIWLPSSQAWSSKMMWITQITPQISSPSTLASSSQSLRSFDTKSWSSFTASKSITSKPLTCSPHLQLVHQDKPCFGFTFLLYLIWTIQHTSNQINVDVYLNLWTQPIFLHTLWWEVRPQVLSLIIKPPIKGLDLSDSLDLLLKLWRCHTSSWGSSGTGSRGDADGEDEHKWLRARRWVE